MRRGSRVLFSRLFSALVLFCRVECCAAAKTESALGDEYSMQLTVRALLGEEMRAQDKKIADVEKQMEKQRAEAKAEAEKQELRIEQQQAQIEQQRVEAEKQSIKAEKQQLQIEQQRVEMKEQRIEAEKQRAEMEQRHGQDMAGMEQRHSQELRDLRQEVREAFAVVQQTVSDTQAGFAGKIASLSKPRCDVSIKMFDDVEGRVEGNERDSFNLQARVGNIEGNLENLFKSFNAFQQQSDGRVGEVIVSYNKLAKDYMYNKLASEHGGLHREVTERHANLQQELKIRAPLATSEKARATSSPMYTFNGKLERDGVPVKSYSP
jgi:chromosome segregation ATPase